MGLSFELARTANPVGVTINQQLEHGLRVVLGTADLMSIQVDTEFVKVQRIHKRIVCSYRGLLQNVFIDALWKKFPLFAVSMSICNYKIPFTW